MESTTESTTGSPAPALAQGRCCRQCSWVGWHFPCGWVAVFLNDPLFALLIGGVILQPRQRFSRIVCAAIPMDVVVGQIDPFHSRWKNFPTDEGVQFAVRKVISEIEDNAF